MATQKSINFKSTFNSDAYEKLFFPEFFELEEPRNWNTITYLIQLLQKNPTITTRNGNKALSNDTKKMQAYVVPGTIADTMLRQMENSLKTTKGKKAVSEFWKTSDTIASTSIRYQKLKYQLQGQMAQEALDEAENRHKKKQRTIQLTESNEADGSQEEGDSDNQDDHNNTGVGDEDNDNDIWNSWKTLLKSLQESSVLPSLSPESHGIIWCGKKVLRRPLLPTNLYDQLNNEVPNIKLQCVHPSFRQIMLVALDAENKEAWLETVKQVQNFNTTTDLIAKRDLITSMFEIFSNLFDGASETLSSSEGCLRYYVVDPALQACNKYLKHHGHNVTFYPGEIELKAMTIQLKAQGIIDKRLKYNGDGTILVNNIGTEVLLSEVSSALAENNKAKTSFDHYKAMFGLLVMLRTLAGHYKYASFDTFKNLKVHFIHTHSHAIRHWTMFTPSPGLYLMNKEQKVKISKDFEQKSEGVIPFMNFMITLGVSLDETMDTLSTLSQEHNKILKETYFETDDAQVSLLDHVNPIVVRLNENKHMNEVANDGPRSPSP